MSHYIIIGVHIYHSLRFNVREMVRIMVLGLGLGYPFSSAWYRCHGKNDKNLSTTLPLEMTSWKLNEFCAAMLGFLGGSTTGRERGIAIHWASPSMERHFHVPESQKYSRA